MIAEVIFSLAISMHAQGQTNPCGDFYTFACAREQQGRFDGTGTLTSVRGRVQLVEVAIAEERSRFESDFAQLVGQNPSLKKKLLKKFNCQPGDECESGVLAEIRDYAFLDVERAYSLTPAIPNLTLSLGHLRELTTDDRIQNLVTQTAERVDLKIVPTARRDQIRNTIFPEVKAAMIEIVEGLPAGPQRTRALEKLRQVNVDVRHCSLGRSTIFSSNAYYEANTVHVCMSLLMATNSQYSLYSLIAHELAHSIDPVTSDVGTADLFSPLTQCLSRPRSIGTADGSIPMSETFSDWMGYEVVSRYVQRLGHPLNRNKTELAIGMANAHPFCSSASPNRLRTSDTHPPGRDRIEMVAAQPALRQRLDCQRNSQLAYCPIQGLGPQQIVTPTLQDSGVAH